jgi:hypothetical protein
MFHPSLFFPFNTICFTITYLSDVLFFPHIHSSYQSPFMYERIVKLALLLFPLFICPCPKSHKKHHYHRLVYVLICLLIYFPFDCYIFLQFVLFVMSCYGHYITDLQACICSFFSFWFLFFRFFLSQAWSLYSASSGMCNSLVRVFSTSLYLE